MRGFWELLKTREFWELASWIATTGASLLAGIGLVVIAVELYLHTKQSRVEFLFRLYGEFDTHDARLAREHIYVTPLTDLRLATLHSPGKEKERRMVEETLAMLDRVAYSIIKGYVPATDAFNLYGGVLLSLAYRLWPYVEDQRDLRRTSGLRRRLGYRKFLETLLHQWVPLYAKAAGLKLPSTDLPTRELLKQLFATAE